MDTAPTPELRKEVEAFCRALKGFCEANGFEIAGTCTNDGIYGEITVHKVGAEEGDDESYWRYWKENKFNFCHHDGSMVEVT